MSNTTSISEKRGKLRLGARGNASRKGLVSSEILHRGMPKGKSQFGAYTPVPEPQHDWNAIRSAKVQCEAECDEFNQVLGCCYLGLLPGLECAGPKRRKTCRT